MLNDTDTTLLECLERGDLDCAQKLMAEAEARGQAQRKQESEGIDGFLAENTDHLMAHMGEILPALFYGVAPGLHLDLDVPFTAQRERALAYGSAVGNALQEAFEAGVNTLAHVLRPHLEEVYRLSNLAGLDLREAARTDPDSNE